MIISLYGGKYYDRLLGLGVCFPFLFDSINNILTPYIYDSTHSMDLIWGIAVFFCFVSVGCALMISKLSAEEEREEIKSDENGNNK